MVSNVPQSALSLHNLPQVLPLWFEGVAEVHYSPLDGSSEKSSRKIFLSYR